MSYTITYDAQYAGSATLTNPTLTISQINVPSRQGFFSAYVRIVYTIRALLIEDSTPLGVQINNAKQVLNTVGGTLTLNYGTGFSQLQAGPLTDIKGGPMPMALNITRLYGNKTAAVEWQIETCVPPAVDASDDTWAWVDFAYTMSTSIDRNFYQTRTVSGVLTLSACHPLTKESSADAFRHLIEADPRTGAPGHIPPIPEASEGTWQRVARDYSLSEDKRSLAFNIVDKQMYVFLPAGMTDGDVSLEVTSEKDGKARFSLRGFFEGSPSQTRPNVYAAIADLFTTFYSGVILQIAYATGYQEGWTLWQERISLVTHLMSNRIEFDNEWVVWGQLDDGAFTAPTNRVQQLSVIFNVEVMAAAALNWLAYLSSLNGVATDEGPYTYIPAIGPSGKEVIGPVFAIDPATKTPSGWTSGAAYVGGQGGASGESALGTRSGIQYTQWQCAWSYKWDYGLVFIPVKDWETLDIIQQTRQPQAYIVATGSAKAIGGVPTLGLPPVDAWEAGPTALGETTGRLFGSLVSKEHSISAPSPEGEITATWNYIYRITNWDWLSDYAAHVPYSPLLEAGIKNEGWQAIDGVKYYPWYFDSGINI